MITQDNWCCQSSLHSSFRMFPVWPVDSFCRVWSPKSSKRSGKLWSWWAWPPSPMALVIWSFRWSSQSSEESSFQSHPSEIQLCGEAMILDRLCSRDYSSCFQLFCSAWLRYLCRWRFLPCSRSLRSQTSLEAWSPGLLCWYQCNYFKLRTRLDFYCIHSWSSQCRLAWFFGATSLTMECYNQIKWCSWVETYQRSSPGSWWSSTLCSGSSFTYTSTK